MTETRALQAREKQELQGEGSRPGPVFRPDIDILERADGYVIYADLPGVDDKSVDVRFDNGNLTLDAQLAILPDEGWSPLHTEYRFGTYHREFRLSEGIDPAGSPPGCATGCSSCTSPRAPSTSRARSR